MIDTFAYSKMDSLLPIVWELRELYKASPYSFYIGKDHSFICMKEENNIYLANSVHNVAERLRKMEEKILAIDTGADRVLIDFFPETPKVVYNFTTKRILGGHSFTPDLNNLAAHLVAFDAENTPLRIAKSRAVALFMINDSMLFITKGKDSDISTSATRNLFVELYIRMFGITTSGISNFEISPYLSPESRFALPAKGIGDFHRTVLKAYRGRKKSKLLNLSRDALPKKEEEKPELPEKDPQGRIYFSELINGDIPDVQSSVDVNIDIDLTEFGIVSAKVIPGKKFFFTIKVRASDKFDRSLITEMLGHSNFEVVLQIA